VNGGGNVNFAARNWKQTFPNVKKWTTIRLFINSSSKNFSAKFVSKPLNETKNYKSETKSPYILRWHSTDSLTKFNITFSGDAELGAISLDGDYGVAVDNIPFRGSSGTFFTQIDTAAVALAMRELNVMLVLLQFGGNAVPYLNSEKARADFADDISRQIRYFRKIRPEARVVLIGPSDMSTKINGKLQTYPHLDAVVKTLKAAAVADGAAFWDMYAAMGGRNSMIGWTKTSPPLATTDYTHFSQLGADKIAEIFYTSLMNYYEYYCLTKNAPQL
jgi:lysophospholipase L1-like esterase